MKRIVRESVIRSLKVRGEVLFLQGCRVDGNLEADSVVALAQLTVTGDLTARKVVCPAKRPVVVYGKQYIGVPKPVAQAVKVAPKAGVVGGKKGKK